MSPRYLAAIISAITALALVFWALAAPGADVDAASVDSDSVTEGAVHVDHVLLAESSDGGGKGR